MLDEQPYSPPLIEDFFYLKWKTMLAYLWTQHFSFWMICCYLFFEYSRPQTIFPVIDIIPWTRLFLIGSLVGAIVDGSVSWVSSRANILIMAFAVVILLSSFTAYFPEISREHYIDFYGWFFTYFLIITIVNTRERFYIFFMIFIFSAAKIAVGTTRLWAMRGFSFTTWGLMGPKGYFQNSGELAILMLTLFPVAYLFLTFKKRKMTVTEKIIFILFTIAPFMTILGASSRGAQIALAVQLLVIFRMKVFKIRQLILIAAIVTAGYYLLPAEQKERFTKMGDDQTSIQRTLYWKHGRAMIREHPLLGIGYFNFPEYYSIHYRYDLFFQRAELPHNIFIQVGTDAGYAGLIPFTLLLLYSLITPVIFFKKFGSDDELVMCMAGTAYGIVGFIIAGQFVTVTYYPFFWLGLSYIVAAKNILVKEHRAAVSQPVEMQLVAECAALNGEKTDHDW